MPHQMTSELTHAAFVLFGTLLLAVCVILAFF
jgi:hypothetical protein